MMFNSKCREETCTTSSLTLWSAEEAAKEERAQHHRTWCHVTTGSVEGVPIDVWNW